MKRRASVVALATLTSLACQRDRHFHTVAVYEASRGRYYVRMDAKGAVRAGADLSAQSEGVLTIWMQSASGPAAAAPFTLDVALHQGQVHLGSEGLTESAWGDRGGERLSRLLSNAGYSVVPEEAAELASAVYGVLLGPKATLMPGQTTVLKVVSVGLEPNLLGRGPIHR